MKEYRKVLSLGILLFFLFTGSAFAHVNGVSIFTINGVKTERLPSRSGIPEDTDLAAGEFFAEESIDFELDISKFPTPKTIFEKTTFIWDFGDGSEKQSIKNGYKNTYTFKERGTYLITISADYSSAGFRDIPPQVLQSVQITVAPAQSNILYPWLYTLPVILLLILVFLVHKKKFRTYPSL